MLTQEFIAKATGATGDDAEEVCKQQLKAIKGLQLKLVQIGKTKVDGDRATVRAVFGHRRRAARRGVFRLEKEDGDWKLAGGSRRRRRGHRRW